MAVAIAVLAGPAAAAAKPVKGPHETVDVSYTTTRPGAPTGTVYTGSYHAAGHPDRNPPYMRRMVTWNPRGFRADTSLPARCTASDLALQLRGPSACPAASRIGGGTTQGALWGNFKGPLKIDVFNATHEEVFLVETPFVGSVSRGRWHPDGTIEFDSPTCYPSFSPPGCPIDNALQLGSAVTVRYTRTVAGVRRGYMTTPPSCPRVGYWTTRVRFWWADGSVDTVATRQSCSPARRRSAR